MARCAFHIDPTKWVNAETVGDRFRVICSLCGAFIGYRMIDDERRRKQPKLRKDEPEDASEPEVEEVS